jgi:hypothetical protein
MRTVPSKQHRARAAAAVVVGALSVTLAGVLPGAAAPEPTITTVVGTGTAGYSGDGGPAIQAQISNAEDAAIDERGRIWVADTYNNVIRRVGRDGVIETVVKRDAGLLFPFDLAVRGDTVWIADSYNHRILRVDPNGSRTVVAGTGTPGFSGDNGPATQAQLRFPFGVDIARDGRVLIADTFNDRVRVVDPDGTIHTVAGTGVRGYDGEGLQGESSRLALPYDVTEGRAGTVVIADTLNHRIREVGRDGQLRTVAGTGVAGYSGDGGPALAAQVWSPSGVDARPNGDLVIADFRNARVRTVEQGRIDTLTGTGTTASTGDGGPARTASVAIRGGVGVSTSGRQVVVVDTFQARVRLVQR